MKMTLKGLIMSMAIAVGMNVSTGTVIAQNNISRHSEFVVRFALPTDMTNPDLPAGTKITGTHEPMNIVTVINDNLSDEMMTSLLHNVTGVDKIEIAEKDQAGNPVYPTGNAILNPISNSSTSAIAFCKDKGCTMLREMRGLGWFAVKLPVEISYAQFESDAKASGLFEDIMRDEIILAEQHVSNDPLYINCWFINQLNDADLDAEQAWAAMPANATIKNVAVIDGHGFDTTHPDMVGQWADTYNAVNQTSDVTPVGVYEKHATACAGIPGAIYNNGEGVPGLGNNLMKVQAIQIGYNATSSGAFYTSSVIEADAISHVIANSNSVVISMSFGLTTYQAAFFNAITSARTTGRNGKGIVVFASTGNSSTNVWTNYPASFSGVVAVGATTNADTRASYSNYGPGLTLTAPGTGIMTTDNLGTSGYSTSDYYNFSGTSAACPVAASVGAMMLIANPELTEIQMKEKLALSCEKVGGYAYSTNATETLSTWSNELGYGRLNMNNGVLLAMQSVATPPDITISSAVVDDNTVMAGQVISISCNQVISNASASSQSPVVEYRWSTDQTWSTTDVVIGIDVSNVGSGIASELENITYTVPTGSGARYILIKCDATSLVTESNETNNTVVIPVTLSTTATLPDVTLSGLSASTITPYVGQVISINCTQSISNAATTSSDVVVEYRLSTDAIWSTTDVVIGTDTSSIGTLTASNTESISYTIPAGTGTRYILIKADNLNGISETNETNNSGTIVLTIAAAPANPDVTINGLSTANTNVFVAQSVTVSCQQAVTNPPLLPITVSLEYRWSQDLVWATTDQLLGTGTSTLGGVVSTEAETFTFTVPSGTGTWYLLIKADSGNALLETNESNIYNIAFNVSLPSTTPDITISGLTATLSQAAVGQTITVNCLQAISITTGASVNVFMEYRWATSTTFSTSFPIIGVDFSSLGAGDADDDESLIFTVPAGAGQRYIMIRCDSNNSTAESNENNNVYVIPVTVSSTTTSAGFSVEGESDSLNEEPTNEETPTLDIITTEQILFSVYPNPAREFINLQFADATTETADFEIRNIQGQLVLNGLLQSGLTTTRLNLTDLDMGIYFLTVRNGSDSHMERIVLAE